MTAVATTFRDAVPARSSAVHDHPPRLLVVTYFAPEARHGGGTLVRQLLEDYPHDRLVWMHHEPPVVDPASPWSRVCQWPMGLLPRPNRLGLHVLKELGNWTFHAERMADEAARRGRVVGIEAVLGIGPGVAVRTSHRIAERLGVPLLLWVHDDPRSYAAYRGAPRWLQWRVQRCFVKAYRAAAARFVISPPMRRRYRADTGCDAIVLPPSLGRLPRHEPIARRNRRLRIGVAGSLAGTQEWETFLAALVRLYGDAPAECQPEIGVFADPASVPIPPAVRERGWVRVAGWRPAEEVDRALAGMDFAYLPLWFAPQRRLHVATSFPTKLVTYLRAGVPILCHVPAYSAAAAFVQRCPVGPLLDTPDAGALADRLRAVFERESWHERMIDAWREAVEEFDGDVLRCRFHDALRTVVRSNTER